MTPQEQLDAILGEAIKALVDSGASPAFLGGFATNYRDRFAQHLGVSVQQPKELKVVIAEAVTEAVHQVFASQERPALAAKENRVRLQVLVDGKRTSVTVRESRLKQIDELVGADESRRVVRELAAAAPAVVDNRSAWLDQQIEAYLQLRTQTPQSMQAH